MDTDKLEALLKAATPGLWVSGYDPEKDTDKLSIHTTDGYYVALVDHGSHESANAALIAAAPDLGAEVLRLRAEQSQTVAANAALAAENARLRDFIQELADAKPEVVKSPVDGDGYIEASYFWDWQSDAGKALAGKAGA